MSEEIKSPCQCDKDSYPFFCTRYQREMHPEIHGICKGEFLPEQRDFYIRNWEKARDAKNGSNTTTRKALPCPHRLSVVGEVECTPCQGGIKPVYGCELYEKCVDSPNAETKKRKIKDCFNCRYLPENIEDEEEEIELSITMAVYDDYDGAWMTIMGILLYHTEALDKVEIVVGDNNPDSDQGKLLKKLCISTDRVKYFTIRDVVGSSLPKDRVIRHARGKYVLHVDSHVLLEPGVLKRLKQHYRDNPDTTELITGPLLHRPWDVAYTHQEKNWRGGNLGTWGVNEDAKDSEYLPFDIFQSGTGLFSFCKDLWLGYHPSFSGYGGNETYLYEQWRRHGRETKCYPWLRWLHRFGQSGGHKYANRWSDKMRNYLITLETLGWDREPLIEHYKEVWGSPTRIKETVKTFDKEFPVVTCNADEDDKDFDLQVWPRKQRGLEGDIQLRWEEGYHHRYELMLKMKALGYAFKKRSPHYEETLEEWKYFGGDKSGAIPKRLWELLASMLEHDIRTLEFGSGASTWLFDRKGCDHTAIESGLTWTNRVTRGLRGKANVILSNLSKENKFYEWEYDGEPFDVVLLDGPFGEWNRHGVLDIINDVADHRTVIFVDDMHRKGERDLANKLTYKANKTLMTVEDGKRQFGVLV